jgi:SAM-dependent methyltransferase
MERAQAELDSANAAFWDELCGTRFAREHGVSDRSPQSIARFDRAYFDFYPYLPGYAPADLHGQRVLEIGLGFGSLGQLLAERGADYHGLDIAPGPVGMMRERITRVGLDAPGERVQQGSALAIGHPDASFDRVFSIGCLHHTGDVRGAVAEVRRVLRPGGTAVVMIYARHSFRRYALIAANLPRVRSGGVAAVEREVRRTYDQTVAGEAAPEIEFLSRRQARGAFDGFSRVRIRRENFDNVKLLRREWFLGNLARVAGVDLYITAER